MRLYVKLWTARCSTCMFRIPELGTGYALVIIYARNTPGSICQYKEDGPCDKASLIFLRLCVDPCMARHAQRQSQLKSTCLTAKFWSFLVDHAETGKKGQNVISSSVQHPISLIFATYASFIIPLPMMWILLTKPMQKSVTTVCLHCSFARLKNKHMEVLATSKVSTQVYMLDRNILKRFRPLETGKKDRMWSVLLSQHPISLIFCNPSFFYHTFTNDVDFVDKAYAEICDHSFVYIAVLLDWKINIWKYWGPM